MKVQIDIEEADLRAALLHILKDKYPAEILTSFGSNDFEVKMTYRANETWKRPRYLRFHLERHPSLI
jgi:hypothetical protein